MNWVYFILIYENFFIFKNIVFIIFVNVFFSVSMFGIVKWINLELK